MGQSIRTITHGKSESRSTMSVTKQRSPEQLENEFVGLGFERLGQQSLLLVTQAVLSGMRSAGWGRIINLSSVAAQTGGVVGPHYAASKAGLIGVTHSYASRFAKEGITANAIAPALVETDMIHDNPNVRPDLIPVGRFGAVDEVAGVAVMLVRDGYVTGQTINVNGGWCMS
jgi:3-oxoacyl-[acyl-carrier protein] reductase